MSDTAEGSVPAPVEAAQAEAEGQETAQLEAAAQTETAPAAETETANEDRRFAAKFAALSRREKQLKAQERQIQERLKQLEATNKPAETPKPAEIPLEQRLKRNPLETLKELGISYEKLTQIALNDGKLTPDLEMSLLKEDVEKKSRSEIEELKAQIEADRKERREAAEKAAKEQEERAIQTYKSQIAEHITAKAEDFELLNAEGAEEASEVIFDLINKHFQATMDEETGQGEVMDIQKAAEMVESHLYEEAKKRIGLNKIKKLLDASKPQQPTPASKQVSTSKPSVTLSNNNSQVQSAAKRFLSDEESKREVSKLLVWNND